MSIPLIGITTYQERASEPSRAYTGQNCTYSRSVIKAGGLPVMIPPFTPVALLPELLSHLDAVLFTGGVDVAPTLYGAPMHATVTEIDLYRDELEPPLIRLVLERNMPLLGVCRGFQILNVALGGTLYTDVASQHPNALHHPCSAPLPRDFESHAIALEADSRLAKIFGSASIKVNSLHHQGVRDLAPGLWAVGRAPDQLIEAVEVPNKKFALAVQWHPEAMPESAQMQALFTAFIRAAAEK